MQSSTQVIVAGSNQGGVRVLVGGAKRTGERSEKWSVFGSTPALLMFKEVLPGV